MNRHASAKRSRPRAPKPEQAVNNVAGRPQTISARWIGEAVLVVLAAAAVCVWGTLCLIFWQGSWQLLYHPTSAILRTPSAAGLTFDEIGFATTDAGIPQLHGWWIPSQGGASNTVLYLHGANGNMSDTVGALAELHAARLGVFTFDYRGYGLSHFARPSERRWREDAESALVYLEGTRHISSREIVLAGEGLGADLALEVAATHSDVAGVILDAPLVHPLSLIFGDPRARLVPAHWLVGDQWEIDTAAAKLSIPSLWFYRTAIGQRERKGTEPPVYRNVRSAKMLVWLTSPNRAQKDEAEALLRWIDELGRRS
jgi:uncharacterized protein